MQTNFSIRFARCRKKCMNRFLVTFLVALTSASVGAAQTQGVPYETPQMKTPAAPRTGTTPSGAFALSS